MTSQKEKIACFKAFTSASDAVATASLKNSNWDIDRAVAAYFDDQSKSSTSKRSNNRNQSHVSSERLNALFDGYKDPDEDAILLEGTEKLCNHLNVDPTDVVTLVLAYHLQCPRMCYFKRTGWISGWTELNCDTLDKMRAVIPTLREELRNPEKFRDIYLFTFMFARNEGQKSLNLETAVAFWNLLLRGKFVHLDLWLEFVETCHGKSISKDTWNLFLEFISTCKEDFSGHDPDGAWPVLIDAFVQYAQDKIRS